MSESNPIVSEVTGEATETTMEPEAQQLDCNGSSSSCSDSALPPSDSPTILCVPDPCENGPTPHPNGHVFPYGTPPVCKPPGARILQQKPRISSTSSVCTQISRDSQGAVYKPSASQAQDSASDDLCATALLACLFCRFYDCLLLTPGACSLCSRALCSHCCRLCPLPPACCSALPDTLPSLGEASCGGCCSGMDYTFLEACYQTTECLELALEISELCYR
ncbi:myoD family inhibitor domain-containing protein 2-like isoform X1 [Rhinatrema bivittatum]|uniref:myoD family inhibitor domain-containing protein 2-like isoform X1 n=1 Tax=Rhinatrema bivittatum TaxID=194408 RepID=UPI00112CE6C7|nr:myoD family inhibitor domain-containing protein 2-like isoform X1 [Rhinatrema bivittatum]